MTNRQEVAEKLRKAGERLRGSCCSGAAVFVTVKDIIGLSEVSNRKAFFDRLADIIDPTCHMVDSEWDNGECTWGCICKECGAKFEHERAIYLNYCPNCGARVVRDE